MLRSSLALILICSSACAMARDGRDTASDACQATETQERASVEDSGTAAPRSSVVRTKYARPTAAPSGGGADDVVPRARGPKWHSFLPGMFR